MDPWEGLGRQYEHPHFTDGKTEAWGHRVSATYPATGGRARICPRAPRLQAGGARTPLPCGQGRGGHLLIVLREGTPSVGRGGGAGASCMSGVSSLCKRPSSRLPAGTAEPDPQPQPDPFRTGFSDSESLPLVKGPLSAPGGGGCYGNLGTPQKHRRPASGRPFPASTGAVPRLPSPMQVNPELSSSGPAPRPLAPTSCSFQPSRGRRVGGRPAMTDVWG